MVKIPVQKVAPDAKLPTYAHPGDAAMDLYANEGFTIASGERVRVPTGVKFAIPHGLVGLVWDKSGLAINKMLKTLGGVIDAGYRGEVIVGIVNLSREEVRIERGDKIAQMILQERIEGEIAEVAALDETARGANGFGSTGR
jgi:dUTP pyrophosphatase